VLAEAFDLCLEVKRKVCPRRVDLAAQLPEELEAVLRPGLCKLVAHELVQLWHDQPVEDVGLDVEIKSGLVWALVVPLAGVGDRLVELRAFKGLLAVPKFPQEATCPLPA
jgi:hypothetical protein